MEFAVHHQVFVAGQERIDGGVLRGKTDASTDLGRVADDVESGDHRRAVGGLGQRGQDAHHRGFAGTVGAEDSGHRPGGHVDVHPGQCCGVAVALHQPGGLNCMC